MAGNGEGPGAKTGSQGAEERQPRRRGPVGRNLVASALVSAVVAGGAAPAANSDPGQKPNTAPDTGTLVSGISAKTKRLLHVYGSRAGLILGSAELRSEPANFPDTGRFAVLTVGVNSDILKARAATASNAGVRMGRALGGMTVLREMINGREIKEQGQAGFPGITATFTGKPSPNHLKAQVFIDENFFKGPASTTVSIGFGLPSVGEVNKAGDLTNTATSRGDLRFVLGNTSLANTLSVSGSEGHVKSATLTATSGRAAGTFTVGPPLATLGEALSEISIGLRQANE